MLTEDILCKNKRRPTVSKAFDKSVNIKDTVFSIV